MKRLESSYLHLFLVLGLFVAGRHCLASGNAADTPSDSPRVERRDLDRSWTFAGEIQAAESQTVGAPSITSLWNFSITYLIPEGTEVRPGDALAEFDSSALALQRLDLSKKREEARIKVAQKEVEIEGRRQDLRLQKAQALRDRKTAELYVGIASDLIARSDLEKYRFDLEKAQIGVEKTDERLSNLEESAESEMAVVQLEFDQADLELRRIEADLERMTVRSPSEGLVLYRENWSTGRKLQVGDQTWKGQPLLRLPNLEQLTVIAIVHHSDVGELRLDAPVEVVLDAYPGRTFSGRTASLPEIAQTRSSRSRFKFFKMKVWLDEMDRSIMKPGMTARVHYSLPIRDALVVPRASLQLASDGSVFVVEDSIPTRRLSVDVIDTSDSWAAVRGEVEEGMLLVVPDVERSNSRKSEIDWIETKRDDLDFHVSGSGLLRASQSVFVRPPSLPNSWNYKIARMAPEGIDVRKGDFLIQFDPQEFLKRLQDEEANLAKVRKELDKTDLSFELEVRDLELELEEARVALEKAENKLTQARQFESNLEVRKAEYEADFQGLRVETLEVKLASKKRGQDLQRQVLRDKEAFYEARVEANNNAIGALEVKAPISGVLVYQPNWNNEKKKVGDQVHMHETIFGIPNLETLRIEGQIAEVDAGRVREGQRVTITVDALPDETFYGRITEIDTIFRKVSFDQPAKVLTILVELDELDVERMRPGMAVRMKIAIDHFEQVVAVPLSAIDIRDGESYIWVKQGEQPVEKKVTVGKDNGIVAIIESGLSPGQEVAGRPVRN